MADTETPAAPAAPAAPRRAVVDWAAQKGTPAIWLRAACVAQHWTDTSFVTVDEATYDAAITAAETERCG